jgi:hypothetical protein
MNKIASHELNPLPPKYKAGALTTEPQHSLLCHYKHSCIKSYNTITVLKVFPPHNSSMLLPYSNTVRWLLLACLETVQEMHFSRFLM